MLDLMPYKSFKSKPCQRLKKNQKKFQKIKFFLPKFIFLSLQNPPPELHAELLNALSKQNLP